LNFIIGMIAIIDISLHYADASCTLFSHFLFADISMCQRIFSSQALCRRASHSPPPRRRRQLIRLIAFAYATLRH
jgi:hypothetical protein